MAIPLIVLLFSCSKKIMEAVEVHKLHDQYFILRQNGHYAFKTSVMGVINMPDMNRGRYLLSNDTVYFVKKQQKNVYKMYGYGLIDSSRHTFTFRMSDTAEWKTFRLYKTPYAK